MSKEALLVSCIGSLPELIMAIPVFKTVKKYYPNKFLVLVLPKRYLALLDNESYIDKLLAFDKDRQDDDILLASLLKLNIKEALLLSYNARLVKIFKRAGITQIYGRADSWRSMFALSTWKKQQREKGVKHEIDYNLDLLSLLGIDEKFYERSVSIKVSDFAKNSVEERFALQNKDFIVMAPVAGNGFVNIRYSFYTELALRIIDSLGVDVYLLSGEDREDIEIVNLVAEQTRGKVYNLAGILDLKLLIAFMSSAKLFIGAPSDLSFLASAVELPILTFYSQLRGFSAKRWKPYGRAVKVFESTIPCKESHCLMEKCNKYLCMDSIDLNLVFTELSTIFNKKEDLKDLWREL